ncbi:MAG TPA: hypothetical protein VFS24_06260 [Steroidobacteraceae bacterium]|nr:hypothetical protein [Steroidobacteraceae bacterium]
MSAKRKPQQHEDALDLDRILALDHAQSRRDAEHAIGERERLAHLSDVELACGYQQEPRMRDAYYVELHARGLWPSDIDAAPGIGDIP